MERKFCFTDYIELLSEKDDSILYSPVFSSNLGLYLFNEEEKPIRDILLINYDVIINYVDGTIRVLDDKIVSVEISDNLFKRRMNITIVGNLFRYDKVAALHYDLDITKAIDYENYKSSAIRKRSL